MESAFGGTEKLILQHIVRSLSVCVFADSFEIVEIVEEETVQFIKIKAILKNRSILYIRENWALDQTKYSYHWQDSEGNLILRWDNAPHHPHLDTSPHHVHKGKKVLPSFRVCIDEVLVEIEKHL